MILLRCIEVFVWMWLLSGRFHPRRHLLLHGKSEGLAKLLQGTECALVRYLLNIHLTNFGPDQLHYSIHFDIRLSLDCAHICTGPTLVRKQENNQKNKKKKTNLYRYYRGTCAYICTVKRQSDVTVDAIVKLIWSKV